MGKNVFFKNANFQSNAIGVTDRFDGVTLLPYIQGDGDSYIDTEVVTSDHCIIMDYQQSAYRTLTHFGTYDRMGTNRMYLSVLTSGNFAVAIGGNVQYEVVPPISQKEDLSRRVIEYNTKEHQVTYNGIPIFDGKSYFAVNESGLSTYLFNYNRYDVIPTNSATYRLYSCKIVNNKTDEVAAYLFPAKRISDGKIGMYDVVNKKFLPNKGNGTFVTEDY